MCSYRLRWVTSCLLITVMVLNICTQGAGAVDPRFVIKPSDPGVDTGIVKATTYLFTDPYTYSGRIGKLHKGERIVLVSRDDELGWLNVIQLSSGHQGWVHANKIKSHYTLHPNQYIDLPAVLTVTTDPPVILVKNQSNKHIYLHIAGLKEIDVNPYSSKQISINAGITAYNVSAPNVIPSFGKQAFTNGGHYTWRFWIEDATGLRNSSDVSWEEKFEFENLQRQIDRKTIDLKNAKISLDAEKNRVDKKYNKWNSDKQLLDMKRSTVDSNDPSTVVEFNNLVIKTNDELLSYQSALDTYNMHISNYNVDIRDLETLKSRQDKLADSINRR